MGFIKYTLPSIISFLIFCILIWIACFKQPFLLKQIWIIGRIHITKNEILQKTNLKKNINLWFIQPNQIVKNLKNINWIDSVIVSRFFPCSIVIQIQEKVPSVIYLHQKTFFLLTKDGKKITNFKKQSVIPREFFELPLITGNTNNINDFLIFYQKLPKNFINIIKYTTLFSDGMDIVLKNGMKIKLEKQNTNLLNDFLTNISPQVLLKQSWKIVDLRTKTAWLITP